MLDSVTNAPVFERYPLGRLDLRLGGEALTPGLYKGRMKVFDATSNLNGMTVLYYEEDAEKEMDALRIEVFAL